MRDRVFFSISLLSFAVVFLGGMLSFGLSATASIIVELVGLVVLIAAVAFGVQGSADGRLLFRRLPINAIFGLVGWSVGIVMLGGFQHPWARVTGIVLGTTVALVDPWPSRTGMIRFPPRSEWLRLARISLFGFFAPLLAITLVRGPKLALGIALLLVLICFLSDRKAAIFETSVANERFTLGPPDLVTSGVCVLMLMAIGAIGGNPVLGLVLGLVGFVLSAAASPQISAFVISGGRSRG